MWKKIKPDTNSLRYKILIFMAVSWLIPIGIITAFILLSYRNVYLEKNEKLIEDGISNAASIVAMRVNEAIRLSQKPTYERDWENLWDTYEKGRINPGNFYSEMNASLKSKYYMDKRFDFYAFYAEDTEAPKCYSSRTGYGLHLYQKEIHTKILQAISSDSNYIQTIVVDNRLLLVRNLYTVSDYRKYGSLVLALNTEALYKELPIETIDNLGILFDQNTEILTRGSQEQIRTETIFEKLQTGMQIERNEYLYKTYAQGYRGYAYGRDEDAYPLFLIYAVKNSEFYQSLNELYRIVMVVALLLIPVVYSAYRYLKKQIENPVEQLVILSKNITEGKFGMTIGEKSMPNAEFDYLANSFGHMSKQIKYLFDSVYNEKLARKDAQIAALQAQINPHFLNNTLEMMNWQARMSGDIAVCKMIESLSIVLDHNMNRSNRAEVYLSEELRCVDAYLYIMSMRFGQRLLVEKDIDESLLRTRVPQLILQPIIENAILHGIEKVNKGTIKISIHSDNDKVLLDVLNTGKPVTNETLERIRTELILAGEEETATQLDHVELSSTETDKKEEHSKHISIGIRNVHKRIRLMYGLQYGLEVSTPEDGTFLTRIVIPNDAIWQE